MTSRHIVSSKVKKQFRVKSCYVILFVSNSRPEIFIPRILKVDNKSYSNVVGNEGMSESLIPQRQFGSNNDPLQFQIITEKIHILGLLRVLLFKIPRVICNGPFADFETQEPQISMFESTSFVTMFYL